jgi:TonB-dependent receptor
MAATLNRGYIQTENIKEKNIVGNIDVKYPFSFGWDLSGYVKLGAKIRIKNRNKNVNQWGGNRWYVSQPILNDYPGEYIAGSTGTLDISVINFLSDKENLDNFLGGDYEYKEVIDESKLNAYVDRFKSYFKEVVNYRVDVQDYEAGETVNSFYFMTEIKWKQFLTLMPGFRYERTLTDYQTNVINPNTTGLLLKSALNDTTGNRKYGNFLPMVHLRIKPFEWMDLRLAYTKSLSRPNYLNLIPYESVNQDYAILRYGNPNLKETRATNYDAYLSFYDTKFGLFTIGKFYKRVYDIDYIRTRTYTTNVYYAPYLDNLKGWMVIHPENLDNVTTVDGWEFELQTNLRFLPSPFDGILLYANLSFIDTETSYPYTRYNTKVISTPPYVITEAIDTSRTGRMIGQADKIANLTIGYEKAGFSARLSMVYQGDALRDNISNSEATDELDKSSVRWDLVVQQHILQNLNVILQVNNITSQREETFIRYKDFMTRTQDYGMTMDLGLQYSF